jgi:hypothetical protein
MNEKINPPYRPYKNGVKNFKGRGVKKNPLFEDRRWNYDLDDKRFLAVEFGFFSPGF